MQEVIIAIARLIRAGRKAYARKWSFLGVFALIFLGSVMLLAQFDVLPEFKTAEAAPESAPRPLAEKPEALAAPRLAIAVEQPARINIPAISLDAGIANPTTTDIVALDKLLLKGAVRYPTSAKLGEEGNVVLFGHSSYLPVVGNQAYKTFNGIQKLSKGDLVTVYSEGTEYVYRVRSVAKEKAAADAGIPLTVIRKVLTLVTCNSFGTKEDRFVVTADFVESRPAGS